MKQRKKVRAPTIRTETENSAPTASNATDTASEAVNHQGQSGMAMTRRTLAKASLAGAALAFLPLGRAWAQTATPEDQTIVGARIHPAIGIGRVGNSKEEYFLGPEVPGVFPDVSYKDSAGAVTRQAARFRVYGVNAAGDIVQELTSADADIEWTVHLAAKKASWYVWNVSQDIPEAGPTPLRNAHIEDRKSLIIDGGAQTVRARSNDNPTFEGSFMGAPLYLGELRTEDSGRLLVLGGRGRSFSPTNKPIQQEQLNNRQYGVGNAAGLKIDIPDTFGPSIDNDEWTDDMSDGPVDAKVVYQGQELPVEGAWAAILCPNYVPRDLYTFRTLWDVVTEAMMDEGLVDPPAEVSFRSHILPIFSRLTDMQWVNEGQYLEFGWGSPADFHATDLIKRLADPSPANAGFRRNLFQRFRNPKYTEYEAGKLPFLIGDNNTNPSSSPRQWLALLPSSYAYLGRWARGDFVNDLEQPSEPKNLSDVPVHLQGEALDRAALDMVEGDAFHPAPELQFIMRIPSMYRSAYRIKRTHYNRDDWGPEMNPRTALDPKGPLQGAGPGDITRWGGVPWQLDVSRCGGSYQEHVDMFGPSIWPMRAPNGILRESDYDIVMDKSRPLEERHAAFATRAQWLRVVREQDSVKTGDNAVNLWPKLGFILPRPGPGDDDGFPETLYVETGAEFGEPEDPVRDVSIWIQQHTS